MREYSDILLIFLLKGARPDRCRVHQPFAVEIPGKKTYWKRALAAVGADTTLDRKTTLRGSSRTVLHKRLQAVLSGTPTVRQCADDSAMRYPPSQPPFTEASHNAVALGEGGREPGGDLGHGG